MLCFLCAFACARAAAAETEGERLFREGREALSRSELELACQKFQESYRIEKALGPLLNLANCEENRGKLVAARTLWLESRALSGDSEASRKLAEERLAALDESIPKLSISLSEDSPAETKVELDGQIVTLTSDAIPVDPGPHVIVARFADLEDRKAITAERKKVYPIELRIEPTKETPKPKASTTTPVSESSSGGFYAGWVVGGIGVASGIGFAITGGLVMSQSGDWQDAGCDVKLTSACAGLKPTTGLYVANGVLGGVGLAGVGVGIILLATQWPEGPSNAPVSFVPGPGDFGFGAALRF